MTQGTKRAAEDNAQDSAEKRPKVKRQWRVPRNNERSSTQPQPIQPGDSGVWATCDKGRERKCIGELRDLFAEYTEALYGVGEIDGADAEKGSMDVESSLQAEIQGLKQPPSALLFAPRQVDVQCVAFIKTTTPIEPVPFVKQICADAMSNSSRKRTRFVKRLTPMTLTARASEQDLENVARKVLAPHFHRQPAQPRKFAIRPTLRNHNVLTRDGIIKLVASVVGPGHEVDLKNYDLLILVEVYKNVCGVSVVDSEFDRMKRYNLAEIFSPTPKPPPIDTANALLDKSNGPEATTY